MLDMYLQAMLTLGLGNAGLSSAGLYLEHPLEVDYADCLFRAASTCRHRGQAPGKLDPIRHRHEIQ